MGILVLLCAVLFNEHHAQALTWDQIQIGMPVELSGELKVNQLLSGAGLQCMVLSHAVYPRVVLGPNGPDVNVRYFRVIGKSTDPITYRVYLESEQLPCGCELNIDQTPEYLYGAGSDFKMLIAPVDLDDMMRTPALATACSSLPAWVTPPAPQRQVRDFL